MPDPVRELGGAPRARAARRERWWRLRGCSLASRSNNSGQAQILHHAGTLFVINGANDVFALDADTGAILWTHRGSPDPRAGVPMGRSSRGVTMGEGKIFVGLNDAQLVALDQRTGEVVWSVEAERWQNGFSITSLRTCAMSDSTRAIRASISSGFLDAVATKLRSRS